MQMERQIRSAVDKETSDLVHALKEKEQEAIELRKRLEHQEAAAKKENDLLRAALTKETAAKEKAERDVEELLTMQSVGQSPKALSLEASAAALSGAGGSTATAEMRKSTSSTSAPLSDAFWQKMREREERARARVRKEFIQKTQEELHAEQRRREEAENAAAEADRAARKAEAATRRAQEQLQEMQTALEEAKGELHRRALTTEEAQSQLRSLEHQLLIREQDLERQQRRAEERYKELEDLAAQREAALEAQRASTHQLLKELGVKDRDLLDKESAHDSVRNEIRALQAKIAWQQETFDTTLREKNDLHQQETEQKTLELATLRERCEDLRKRCDVAERFAEQERARQAAEEESLEAQRQMYQNQLLELRVEHRSLQLQLEKMTEAARRHTHDRASQQEMDRQERESLMRKYAAEATAVREELTRVQADRQKEKEKHLRAVLELSEQLTAQKQRNIKMEHALNQLEHENTEASRLLLVARDEMTVLRHERGLAAQRLAAGSASVCRPSCSVGSSAWLTEATDEETTELARVIRRLAEVEAVRNDLNHRLAEANATIQWLMQKAQGQPSAFEQSPLALPNGPSPSSSSSNTARPAPQRSNAGTVSTPRPSLASPSSPPSAAEETLRRRVHTLETELRERLEEKAALKEQCSALLLQLAASSDQPSGKSSASANGLVAALKHVVAVLEIHLRQAEAAAAPSFSGKGGSQQVSKRAVDDEESRQPDYLPAELELLKQAHMSCMAALDSLQGNRTSSPYAAGGEEGEDEQKANEARVAPAPHAREADRYRQPSEATASSSAREGSDGSGLHRVPSLPPAPYAVTGATSISTTQRTYAVPAALSAPVRQVIHSPGSNAREGPPTGVHRGGGGSTAEEQERPAGCHAELDLVPLPRRTSLFDATTVPAATLTNGVTAVPFTVTAPTFSRSPNAGEGAAGPARTSTGTATTTTTMAARLVDRMELESEPCWDSAEVSPSKPPFPPSADGDVLSRFSPIPRVPQSDGRGTAGMAGGAAAAAALARPSGGDRFLASFDEDGLASGLFGNVRLTPSLASAARRGTWDRRGEVAERLQGIEVHRSTPPRPRGTSRSVSHISDFL